MLVLVVDLLKFKVYDQTYLALAPISKEQHRAPECQSLTLKT